MRTNAALGELLGVGLRVRAGRDVDQTRLCFGSGSLDDGAAFVGILLEVRDLQAQVRPVEARVDLGAAKPVTRSHCKAISGDTCGNYPDCGAGNRMGHAMRRWWVLRGVATDASMEHEEPE